MQSVATRMWLGVGPQSLFQATIIQRGPERGVSPTVREGSALG